MYQEVFNLNSRPFTLTPYMKHFVAVGPVQQSLEQIKQTIARDAGPNLVAGDHGMGKTLLLALLAQQYAEQFCVVNLACGPMTERRDLLQAILFELKQPYRDMTEGELRLSLIDYIKPTEDRPNGLLLLVDDGQSLTPDLIDELRLITNFVRDGVPRVRLVLAGTGRLEETLTEPKLEPFNQRISARCFLSGLTRDQVQVYVHEHVTRAGGDAANIFGTETCRAIHEWTQGCPRFINQLCEQSLIAAEARGMLVVEPNTAAVAWAEVQGLPVPEEAIASPAVSEQEAEEWTVIEFGSLDDEDDVQPASAESTNAEQHEAQIEFSEEFDLEVSELPDPSAAVVETEVVNQDQEAAYESTRICAGDESAQVDAFGIADRLDQDSADDFNTETGFVEGTDEAVTTVFEPTDKWNADTVGFDGSANTPDESGEPQTGEVLSLDAISALNQDQVATWEAAGVVEEEPAPESSTCDASSASTTPFESTDGECIHEAEQCEVEEVESVSVSTPVEVVNPFDESFDSEETVSAQFSGLIADQNVASSQVTSSELSYLQPIAPTEPTGDSSKDTPVIAYTASPLAAEELDRALNALGAGEPESMQVQPNADESGSALGAQADDSTGGEGAVSHEQSGDSFADVGSDEDGNELDSQHRPSLMEEDDSVAFVPQPFAPSADPFVSQANAEPRVADELDSLESAVSHESVAPEGSANDRDYDRLAAVMASLGAESEPAEPVATPFVADATVDETMSIAPVDQEPTLTAFVDELTGDATTSPAVGSEFHEHVDESLSPEIQRKADEIMRSLSVSVESESDPVSHETPVSLQETDTSLQSGQLEPAEDAELTESQQILNEILEQKQLLASQLSSDAVDATSHPQDLAPEVQPAQDDVGASTGDSAGSLPLENVSDVVPVDPVLPMTASEPPVSTGKASRMDYEALFKQLRNTDDET